jgi:hypothetical protein
MENNKSNILKIIFSLLLVIGLIGGVILVSQNQNTQRGAYFSGAKLLILPETIATSPDTDVPVQLWVDTANNAKVSAVDTEICYGNGLKLDAADTDSLLTLITLNTEAFKVVEFVKNNADTKCLRLVAVSSGINTTDLKSGLVKVANIRFKSLSSGSGEIKITKSKSIISGYNPTPGATDTSMSISSVVNAPYTIGTGGTNPTVTPSVGQTNPVPTPDGVNYLLNYKMSFGGVVAANAKCLVEWPFKITVLSNGSTKTYTGVMPQNNTTVNNKLVFSGTLTLAGFNHSSNIAVFASGPKHLQVKYGKDLQTSSYNQAGGSLTLTKTNSPVYDFSGYPLVAGDVVSNTSQDVQDGIINGVDYAYVKSKANIHETVPEDKMGEVEGYLRGDLNGDCQVNSGDVTVMKSSLQERQGQLY